MMHIPDILICIENLLSREESKGPLTGYADLVERAAARQNVNTHLASVANQLHGLQHRLAALPALPNLSEVQWAQAVLACDNLAFLEIDTDGLKADACLLRVFLLDKQEQVLFDTFLKPERPLTAQIIQITGISVEAVQAAPTLAEAWPGIIAVLRGKYLLSYHLDFDREHLRENAARSHVEMPYLLAECLMQRAAIYFRESGYPKLTTLCRRIGHPLPESPQQTALHRAIGQLRLLEAMAQGLTGAVRSSAPVPIDLPDLDDTSDDDPPF